MWHPITKQTDVPEGPDVRLAVINSGGEVHALVFPSRRRGAVWVEARNGRVLELHPTHWQAWTDEDGAAQAQKVASTIRR